ncbi:helix-turn-helix domain-containing protein [Actinocorallia longicatena]|uniref:HTH cro/C1-type domain-containing protein n=1 Tax=Actinocorallia longicatena TaxID=111803 RepID=A0ABP6Q4R7_9ACTN
MEGNREIRFASVLRGLLDERFKNSRREFAARLHISESALSQYVRGKATPGLSMLASIAAELDVSLDYLVFGVEQESPTPDYGEFVAHLEHAFNRSRAESASTRDFVSRVGALLSQQIETAVDEVLKDITPRGLTTAEIIEIEGHSRITRIATADLDSDIVLLGFDPGAPGGRAQAAAGPFTSVVISNIKKGRTYYYAIPEGAEWRYKAERLRQVVANVGAMSLAAVDQRIRFHESDRSLVPGFVIYETEPSVVTAADGPLLGRAADLVDPGTGLIVLATSYNDQIYVPIEPKYHRRVVRDYETTIRSGPRLTFG